MNLLILLICMSQVEAKPTVKAKPTPKPSQTSKFEIASVSEPEFFMKPPKMPWVTDPFERNPGYMLMTTISIDQFQLTGILYSRSPIAVINGKQLKIGDEILDRTVASIGENYVRLKNKKSEIELTLPPMKDVDEFKGPENVPEDE